jgi:DNA-binding LytR/AlgR family response regulator
MNIGNKITVNYNGFIYFFDYKEVLFLKSDNYYTTVYLDNGKEYLVIKSLARLERELKNPFFIRVNQSYLINKAHVVNIDKKKKTILLYNNHSIPFTITLKKLVEFITN